MFPLVDVPTRPALHLFVPCNNNICQLRKLQLSLIRYDSQGRQARPASRMKRHPKLSQLRQRTGRQVQKDWECEILFPAGFLPRPPSGAENGVT